MEKETRPYELDNLDRKILSALMLDSRKAYTEIAEEAGVSGGTIHVRMEKLRQAGIVKGSKLQVDYSKAGYGISAFVGINLHNARDYPKALEKLKDFPNILEAHYTTGPYNVFTKVIVKSIEELYRFLLQLQNIKEIHGTQTIMILDNPISRDFVP